MKTLAEKGRGVGGFRPRNFWLTLFVNSPLSTQIERVAVLLKLV